MATRANVVVSAFATPPGEEVRAAAQPTNLITAKPTVVLEVQYQQYMRPEDNGMAARAFSMAADALRDPSGSILNNLFKRYLVGYEPESIALIGFSAGAQFTKKVLAGPDAQWIDALIDLDGVALNKDWRGQVIASEVKPWADFGERASLDEKLMVLAHTNIAALGSAVTSTTASAEAILDAVSANIGPNLNNWCPTRYLVPENVCSYGPPPPPVTIRPGGSYPTKTYESCPLQGYDQIGNMWVLDYGGTTPADHIYTAWYAQRDIWNHFLVPRWNGVPACRFADMKNPMQGLGALGADDCVSNRVYVPSGTYDTASILRPILAGLEGLAVGVSLGYLLGHRIGA